MVKKILITGKNSYIGNSLEEWFYKNSEYYVVTKKSVRNDKWKKIDFSLFDVVVHVAGIAHQDTKLEQKELYYEVNTKLTIDIAKKAKEQGVKQFIFLSSIIVYGASGQIGQNKIITKETIPKPINFYGNSKLLAEKGIKKLQNEHFKVVIIRPPMIYGRGSKGNFQLLSKLAKISPVFPQIDNKRSMLHIDNLCEFIKLMINNEENGVFFPQNKEYVVTSEMVKMIANLNKKKIFLFKFLNPIIKLCSKKSNLINKVFGTFIYSKDMSLYKEDYCVRNFVESIEITEDEN